MASSKNTLDPKHKNIISLYGEDFVKDVCPKFPTAGKGIVYPSLYHAVSDTNAPSLVDVDNIYGKGASILWIEFHLLEIQIYTGVREKLLNSQRRTLAIQLRNLGYHVKLSEFMLFFDRFEQGYYEQFKGYERPNPQVVTSSFVRFLDDLKVERNNFYTMVEEEQQRIKREQWEKDAVPCPDYIREKLMKLGDKFPTKRK